MAAGYIVEEADNGEDAAHLGSTGEFDAIVLDLGLPVIDGLTVMARLALITAVWSAVALLVTGVILTELFRSDAEREFDARIAADLVHLVRDAAGRPAGEPALPVEPLGPLFREPFSGWAWQVRRGDQIVAQSGSLGPLIDGVMEPLRAPGTAPADFIAPGGIASRGAARPILLGGESEPLIFAVARPRAEIDGSLSYFSTLLLYSLAVFGAVMFAGSLLLTRIMLAPVTRLEEAVRRMRDGETAPLDGRWPREIVPVIGELKDLDTHIDRLIERSRNQTSDLVHALRTPLSIMRQAAERALAGAAEPLIALLEQGRKRQLLTVTQDGAGLGRVLDQRPGLPERRFTGDVVFPLGVWAQGEVREFEATEFTLFGPARHLITLEILDIDHVYDGVAQSLGYRLTIRDEAGRELDCEVSVYSPGRGLVAFEARSYWQNGGCNT